MALKPTPLQPDQNKEDRSSSVETAISVASLRFPPPQDQPDLPDAQEFRHDGFGGKREPVEERLDKTLLDENLLLREFAKLGDKSKRLVHEFMKTMPELKSNPAPEPAKLEPAAAYKLWCDRPAGRGTNPAKWIQEQHGDLIGTEGARAAIGRRDPLLMGAYATWITPKRHPEDDLKLDTKPLTDLSQMPPEEALKLKRAQARSANQRHRSLKRFL